MNVLLNVLYIKTFLTACAVWIWSLFGDNAAPLVLGWLTYIANTVLFAGICAQEDSLPAAMLIPGLLLAVLGLVVWLVTTVIYVDERNEERERALPADCY